MYRLFFFSFFFLFGCSQTVLTSSWFDQAFHTPVKNMFVVAMSDNLRARRIFEDKMVQQLMLKNVKAIASYSIFPNKLPDKKELDKYVKDSNLQTVFIGKMVNIEDKKVTYPGGFGSGVSFNNYYGSTYGYIYDDSYTVSYEYVNIEFTVFDVKSNLPIWSASSESVDPSDLNKIVDELVAILMADMDKNLLRKSSIPK